MMFYIIKIYYFRNVYNWWDVSKRKLYTNNWDRGSINLGMVKIHNSTHKSKFIYKFRNGKNSNKSNPKPDRYPKIRVGKIQTNQNKTYIGPGYLVSTVAHPKKY